MSKIAFVVQRYGKEVNGGSEAYTRMLAEKMTEKYEVHVLTTCALNYTTWENHFNSGEEVVNNVIIHRFNVDTEREVESFNEISLSVYAETHSEEDEDLWINLQGPVSSDLICYIENNREKFKWFFLMTYLYYPTFKAMPIVSDKAVFIPTAHDEPPIYLKIFEKNFQIPSRIGYLTPEEKSFVNSKFNNKNIPSEIIGSGLDIETLDFDVENLKNPTDYDYLLYVGRIDESKGCDELFTYYLKYIEKTNLNLKLILIGKSVMEIPNNHMITSLGFVDDKVKFQYMKYAKLLIIPSYYESLSLVTLESMFLGVPVLVNGQNDVLKGHCLRSNGGLYYRNKNEFFLSLHCLLSDNNLYRKMAKNSQRYVQKNYTWSSTFKKVEKLIH